MTSAAIIAFVCSRTVTGSYKYITLKDTTVPTTLLPPQWGWIQCSQAR